MFETVRFHEDELLVSYDQAGQGWVPIKPICEAIGIQTQRQQEKLVEEGRFNCTHMYAVAEDGKQREMLCIHVSKVNSWLNTINRNKVPDLAVRARLCLYQDECDEVLFKHFMPRGGTGTEMGQVLHRLVDSAVDHERRIKSLEDALDIDGSNAARKLASLKRN